MLRFVISVFGAVMLGGCATRLVSESHQALLTLPYRQFDQTPSCWHPLADQREFREAAGLIDAYSYFPRHPEADFATSRPKSTNIRSRVEVLRRGESNYAELRC
jgi:hypothetical protein